MKKIITILLILFVLSGCTAHVDKILRINLTANVRAQYNDAEIYFIDTGLDYVRKKKDEKLHITTVSKNTQVNKEFFYRWGSVKGFFVLEQDETFRVCIKKPGNSDERCFDFNLKKMDRNEEGFYVIDLDELSR